jgi:hypothetical protein
LNGSGRSRALRIVRNAHGIYARRLVTVRRFSNGAAMTKAPD